MHELIWSIDAKHREIPTSKEINHGLLLIGQFKKSYSNDTVKIIFALNSSDSILDNDIQKAMKIYNRTVENFINKK